MTQDTITNNDNNSNDKDETSRNTLDDISAISSDGEKKKSRRGRPRKSLSDSPVRSINLKGDTSEEIENQKKTRRTRTVKKENTDIETNKQEVFLSEDASEQNKPRRTRKRTAPTELFTTQEESTLQEKATTPKVGRADMDTHYPEDASAMHFQQFNLFDTPQKSTLSEQPEKHTTNTIEEKNMKIVKTAEKESPYPEYADDDNGGGHYNLYHTESSAEASGAELLDDLDFDFLPLDDDENREQIESIDGNESTSDTKGEESDYPNLSSYTPPTSKSPSTFKRSTTNPDRTNIQLYPVQPSNENPTPQSENTYTKNQKGLSKNIFQRTPVELENIKEKGSMYNPHLSVAPKQLQGPHTARHTMNNPLAGDALELPEKAKDFSTDVPLSSFSQSESMPQKENMHEIHSVHSALGFSNPTDFPPYNAHNINTVHDKQQQQRKNYKQGNDTQDYQGYPPQAYNSTQDDVYPLSSQSAPSMNQQQSAKGRLKRNYTTRQGVKNIPEPSFDNSSVIAAITGKGLAESSDTFNNYPQNTNQNFDQGEFIPYIDMQDNSTQSHSLVPSSLRAGQKNRRQLPRATRTDKKTLVQPTRKNLYQSNSRVQNPSTHSSFDTQNYRENEYHKNNTPVHTPNQHDRDYEFDSPHPHEMHRPSHLPFFPENNRHYNDVHQEEGYPAPLATYDEKKMRGRRKKALAQNVEYDGHIQRMSSDKYLKMFVSVQSEEQIEVALTKDGVIVEYFVEMTHQAKIRGNIYKAIIDGSIGTLITK